MLQIHPDRWYTFSRNGSFTCLLKVVHFAPESVVHYNPDLLVHFAPELVVHYSPDYTLMGIEGNIRKTYYESFNLILNEFMMTGRSYRPPENEINALISFGNMMCYSQCLRAIHQTQLNPLVSFLHQPGERRFSLSLDLAEIFKPILVDRVIFKVVNKREIQPCDFETGLNSVTLKVKGRKRFVQAFENRLNETIKHRSLDRNVSYKHFVKLECYKLVKHVLGIEEYKPLKMWW